MKRLLQQGKSTPGIMFHLDFKIKTGLKFYNCKISFLKKRQLNLEAQVAGSVKCQYPIITPRV